jgi:hypothetical protein
MGQGYSSAAIIPAPQAQEEVAVDMATVSTRTSSSSSSAAAGDALTTAKSLVVVPMSSNLLTRRCIRAYGWDKALCERAVVGYGQFMALKRYKEDWKGSVFAPPPVIDRVWQMHVLDTQRYATWCKVAGRHMVHYCPDNYLDDKQQLQQEDYHVTRIRHTVEEMKKFFAIDTTDIVWSFAKEEEEASGKKKRKAEDHGSEDDENEKDDDEDEEAVNEEKKSPRKRQHCRGSAASSSSSTSSNSSSDESDDVSSVPGLPSQQQQQPALPLSRQPLTIFVRWGQNPDPNRSQDLYFKIRPDTKMQRVFDRYTIYWNDAVANLPAAARGGDTETMQDFVFFFGSRMVRPTDTASSLGLVADDMLYATRCSAVEDDDSSPAL